MSAPKDGGSAYPQHGWSSDPDVLARMAGQGGITVRQYYKAAALQAMRLISQVSEYGATEAARDAGSYADALLAEDEEHAKK